jgi:hypothetical protein
MQPVCVSAISLTARGKNKDIFFILYYTVHILIALGRDQLKDTIKAT